MLKSSTHLSWMSGTESRPSAPQTRQAEWVWVRPKVRASRGSANEKTKQTPL